MLRCDETFLEMVDRWRVAQGEFPPPRSVAIRTLAARGAAMDSYLALVLRHCLVELAENGLVSKDTSDEFFKRLQRLIVSSLDLSAALKDSTADHRDEAFARAVRECFAALEMPGSRTFEHKTQSNSRRR